MTQLSWVTGLLSTVSSTETITQDLSGSNETDSYKTLVQTLTTTFSMVRDMHKVPYENLYLSMNQLSSSPYNTSITMNDFSENVYEDMFPQREYHGVDGEQHLLLECPVLEKENDYTFHESDYDYLPPHVPVIKPDELSKTNKSDSSISEKTEGIECRQIEPNNLDDDNKKVTVADRVNMFNSSDDILKKIRGTAQKKQRIDTSEMNEGSVTIKPWSERKLGTSKHHITSKPPPPPLPPPLVSNEVTISTSKPKSVYDMYATVRRNRPTVKPDVQDLAENPDTTSKKTETGIARRLLVEHHKRPVYIHKSADPDNFVSQQHATTDIVSDTTLVLKEIGCKLDQLVESINTANTRIENLQISISLLKSTPSEQSPSSIAKRNSFFARSVKYEEKRKRSGLLSCFVKE